MTSYLFFLSLKFSFSFFFFRPDGGVLALGLWGQESGRHVFGPRACLFIYFTSLRFCPSVVNLILPDTEVVRLFHLSTLSLS